MEKMLPKQFGTEILEAAPQCVASEASIAHTQHSPAKGERGSVFASANELTALNRFISHCITVLSIPCMDIVAPRLWGWGWGDIRRWSVKRKQLLLEAWRRWAGYEDEESDEAQVQRIWLLFCGQFSAEKPPPSNFRLSLCWLTPSSPLALRAPTFAA